MSSVVESAIRSVVGAGVEKIADFNRKRLEERDHEFLSGIHAPIHDELTLTDLKVTGTIPAELSGRYVRIGPNPFTPTPKGHHWFIGDGMVHGVRLAGGKAEWYRNRYIRSQTLEGAGGPAAAPGPRRGRSDTVNTNVIPYAGKTLAIVEAGSYPAILSDELETIAYSDFEGTLGTAFTAHPHEDPATGELHAITYDAMTPTKVWHVVADRAGRVVRQEAVPVSDGPMIHECTITKNYVLILDLPVTFSMKAVMAGYSFPYVWNPQHKARVGLLPRTGTADDVIWCAVDPCYVFHIANSYEDDQGRVVVDSAVYETMFKNGMDGPNGRSLGFERWTIDPVAKRVARQTIDAAPQEFPRPDERFFGAKYRHAWAIGLPGEGSEGFMGPQPLYHHDLETGRRQVRDFGPGAVPGEFVFVPRKPDAAEGDGWVMGYVIDSVGQTTDLVILNALDIEGEAVARVHIPHRIPTGFHGNWMPDAR